MRPDIIETTAIAGLPAATGSCALPAEGVSADFRHGSQIEVVAPAP